VIRLSDVKACVQYPDGGRAPLRRERPDDSALAGAVASRRPARPSATLSSPPRPRITPGVIELIGQARRDLAHGAQRTQLWLRPSP
jgi:hypothetical protein